MWFGTFAQGRAASRGIEVWTYYLQGRLPSPWNWSPVSFEWIGHGSFFRKNWDKGPCSPAPRGLQRQCSEGSSTCDLAHLLPLPLLWGGWSYGSAIFRGCCPHHGAGPLWVSNRLATGHFSGVVETRGLAVQLPQVHEGGTQPVAPDVMWHIYSGQHCFKGFGGMDLPSSGDVALTVGQVPCKFWADWPNFIFQGKLRQGAWQWSSPGLWEWCMHSSSWHDLAHLLQAAQLKGGRRYPLPIFAAHLPTTWGRSPVNFEKISCWILDGLNETNSDVCMYTLIIHFICWRTCSTWKYMLYKWIMILEWETTYGIYIGLYTHIWIDT